MQAIDTLQAWHNALNQLPNPHILQSWAWGDFKSRWGWRASRWLWQADDGTPQAAAQILMRPIPHTPWRMLYLSKGPVWHETDLPLVTQVLSDVENFARENNALFVKIDPDVPLAFGTGTAEMPHEAGQTVRRILMERGWQYSPQQIQFKNTVLLDLTASEDEILAAMKSKTRYNIRLSARKGVTIRQGDESDLETFYRLYATTAKRDAFLIRPREYYLDVWQDFLRQGLASLFLADLNGENIAAVMLFRYGKTAWYMYGASDNAYRNVMPNHLLQWSAMKSAKTAGCETYDMWGAPDVFDESDSMWGVYRFKLGFNGITRQGLGAFDFPVRPMLYRAYSQILPRALRVIRRI